MHTAQTPRQLEKADLGPSLCLTTLRLHIYSDVTTHSLVQGEDLL